jgi:monoamine oxidase
MPLSGVRVLVAGAGLAGLAAARALEADGAEVDVVEARDRVGGRVWTIREGFAGRQHAEAGADLIESNQEAVVTLARELRLPATKILKRGFGYFGTSKRGGPSIQRIESALGPVWHALGDRIRDYRLAEQQWDSPIVRVMGRQSVADWLAEVRASPWAVQRVRGMRGLFLADPEELALLALVDFFAEDPFEGDGHMLRLTGGNDRLATAAAAALRNPPRLGHVLRRVRHDASGVVATVEHASKLSEIRAHYLVSALPATTLRRVAFEPALPVAQQQAIAALKYGTATRLLLQCASRFWRSPGRPTAFGSDQPFGAVWDGNEQQRGPKGILSFLAGGRASAELRQLLRLGGESALLAELRWPGTPSKVVASRTIVWEDDEWVRGGYAYFDPGFDPRWRAALSMPTGRLHFAGEHTSHRWQGYMNGALESGYRAAAEIRASEVAPKEPHTT